MARPASRLSSFAPPKAQRVLPPLLAASLLSAMGVLAGGAAWRESVTIDEVAHIGAGVSYLQRLDLRLNEEHPPLPQVLAAFPLVLRGTRADYASVSWTISGRFFPAYLGQWVFGEWLLTHWNDPVSTLRWARLPMLAMTLALGWLVWLYAGRLGGPSAGLLCLGLYVSAPVFLTFGPLVHTDLAVTLFALLTLWTFAEVWQEPSGRNVARFALALAGALLSKFVAGLLFLAFAAFALSTRWRAVPGQPGARAEARAWRRLRWRATLRGVFGAGVCVYLAYFVLSWNQPTDVLYRVGHGALAVPLRRLLMPPWLYLRGLLLFGVTASRPTFILGHSYPHGVFFYFPVLLALKSPPGFLGLLLLAGLLAVAVRRPGGFAAVPAGRALHFRVLWTALLVFAGACLLSRLNISFRHFSIPLVLLILLLALLPPLLEGLGRTAPRAAWSLRAVAAVLLLGSLYTALAAYPYYFPYLSPLALGRPPYALVNDSNLDWNQALPEVQRFAERHGVRKFHIDTWGFTDTAVAVPGSEIWNCQRPAEEDAGQWVALSANMIQDGHNCLWLMQYPHESLGGGSMYAVRLPATIPPPGSPGGPPLPSARREFLGASPEMRLFFQEIARYPERLPKAFEEITAAYRRANEAKAP